MRLNVATQMYESVEDYCQYPDANGHFGQFGGLFVAETLLGPLQSIEKLMFDFDVVKH